MALSPKLYYYSGGWQDITQYIVEPGISEILYRIDNKVQGEAMFLDLVLSIECPYYGSNKYKLELGGSDYWLLGAPGDGIKTDYINRQIHLVLVDYFFYVLTGKAPLKINGEGDVDTIAGEGITVKTINDIIAGYTTNQEKIDIEGFSTRDGINFYDGLGNTVNITQANIRYKTKGKIQGKDQSANVGQYYVDIRDVINDLVTAEGFTLDVDFGYEESSIYAYEQNFVGTDRRVWDCKVINGYVLALFSHDGSLRLRSHNRTTGNTIDTISWTSRDWVEGASGEDFLGYQIYPDYRNNCCYICGWYCASFNPAASNDYIFRILKVSVASDGTLTQVYDAKDTGGTDFWTIIDTSPGSRINYRQRQHRFPTVGLNSGIAPFSRMTWYTDGTLAASSKFRIIMLTNSLPASLFVIDPDRWQAGLTNDFYEYTTTHASPNLIPDWINGSVMIIHSSGGNWVKKIFRVNMPVLSAAYAVEGDGGRIHVDDDPGSHTVPVIGAWGESLIYDDTIPAATGNFRYHPPQVPNGHLVREGVYNHYTEKKDDYFGNNYSHDVTYGGSAWDDSTDRALIWHTDADAAPTYLYWDIHDHYTYKRMYRYQPYIYIDRKQQFIDAFASAGFFYEQKNGNVRLFRIKGSGSNIGTIPNADLLNLREINEFSRFADEYSIKVLTRQIVKESGTVNQSIKTLINDYGFFSKLNALFYSDWTAYLKLGQVGKEFLLDAEQFYSITSTYLPNLGDLITYDSDDYMIIQAALDLINKRIAIQCIAV